MAGNVACAGPIYDSVPCGRERWTVAPLSVNLARRQRSVRTPADVRTYLDSRTKINGKLSFEAPAQIDGHVEGEIVAGDHLVIGEGAQVTAKIKAGSVVVAGMVSGEIVATERIEMRASAKMTGNLAAPRLVERRSSRLQRSCRID